MFIWFSPLTFKFVVVWTTKFLFHFFKERTDVREGKDLKILYYIFSKLLSFPCSPIRHYLPFAPSHCLFSSLILLHQRSVIISQNLPSAWAHKPFRGLLTTLQGETVSGVKLCLANTAKLGKLNPPNSTIGSAGINGTQNIKQEHTHARTHTYIHTHPHTHTQHLLLLKTYYTNCMKWLNGQVIYIHLHVWAVEIILLYVYCIFFYAVTLASVRILVPEIFS